MKFLAALLLILGLCDFANAGVKTICGIQAQTGYVIINVTEDISCTVIIGSSWNAVVEQEYDNLPVGATLSVCGYTYSNAAPPGWTVTSTYSPGATCYTGIQYANVQNISHTSCVNEAQSLCYPAQPITGSITASASTVGIPNGETTGSVNISYTVNGGGGGCIWAQNSGSSAIQLWSCGGASGSGLNWPYLPVGGTTTFYLNQSTASPTPALASTVVHGVADNAPLISASPSSMAVPAGQTGTTTISYNTNNDGYNGYCIWVQNTGSAVQLWACGGTGSGTIVWPYVPKGGTSTFWINGSSTSSSPRLATTVVTGY